MEVDPQSLGLSSLEDPPCLNHVEDPLLAEDVHVLNGQLPGGVEPGDLGQLVPDDVLSGLVCVPASEEGRKGREGKRHQGAICHSTSGRGLFIRGRRCCRVQLRWAGGGGGRSRKRERRAFGGGGLIRHLHKAPLLHS